MRTGRWGAAAGAAAIVLGGTGLVFGAAAAAATTGAARPAGVLSTTPNGWTAVVPDGGIGSSPIAESSPNVANLTGGPSVVVGDRAGNVYAYNLSSGRAVPGWGAPVGAPVTSTPSVTPYASATGRNTVLVGTGNTADACTGGYKWLRPTGTNPLVPATNYPGFPCAASGVQASMAIGTLQGTTSAVAGNLGDEEYAFNTRNTAVDFGFPWFQADTSLSTPAIGDLFGTGVNEIVEGGASSYGLAPGGLYQNGGHIRILRATGNLGTGTPAGGLICEYNTGQQVTSSPAVGKFLGGGAVGIVSGTGSYWGASAPNTNQVIAINTTCGLAWADTLAGTTSASPALANTLGNGQLQVIESTRTGTVYDLTGASGTVKWHTPLGVEVIGSPVTAPLTGHQDVLVASINGLFVLTGTNGNIRQRVEQTYGFQNSPLVTDTGGSVGITVAGYGPTSSVVFHWKVVNGEGAAVNGSGSWPEFHHDPQLSGNAGTPMITCKSAHPSPASGYYMSGSDGGIFTFGNVPFCGSTGSRRLNAPIVGLASTKTARGYWEVASDGGIFTFGTVQFYGSEGGKPLNAPIVGMAAMPTGGGYWEVASDGGIFTFGNAQFYGSKGGQPLNAPIVGMAATPTGGGYWEVASDGGIFTFGNAQFHGSKGGQPLNKPIVGMAADPQTGGYWLVASDGGIFSFDAPFLGSKGGQPLNAPIVGMSAANGGGGYWLVASDGGIFTYGNAAFLGSQGGKPLNRPIVGMAGF